MVPSIQGLLVVHNEIRGADEELAHLEAEAENFEHQIIVLNDFVATTTDISGRLDELSLEERAEVIQSVVSKITVGTDVDIKMALGAGCVRRTLEA